MMKKLALLLFLLVGTLSFGQLQTLDTPDCQIGLDSDGVNNLNSNDIDNRTSVCTSWTLVYTSTGLSAVSIEFQSAPDSGGVPGAYVTWANVNTGSTLPMTSTVGGQVMGFRFQPHARIHINSATGTGRIIARLLGYKPFKGATDPTSGSTNVQGAVAANTAGAGVNPVAIGAYQSPGGTIQDFVCGNSGGTACGFWQGPSTPADGITALNSLGLPYNPGNGTPLTGGLRVNLVQYNGTTLDTQRNASLANLPAASTLTARNSIGAALSEKGSRFSVISNPAAGSQATASIAAEAAVRHVADCVSFAGGSVVAPALTALTVNLRDGATGAGTVIWTQQVIISAATGQNVAPFSVCGLNLVGTTNTAMTLEFSASLANLSESATVTGFNVN